MILYLIFHSVLFCLSRCSSILIIPNVNHIPELKKQKTRRPKNLKMTSLKAISVSGIRSYEPNAKEAISFNQECQIIHGHNGSGKTSLLESMKWCLSGQFPPTSNNGKTFISDPRVKEGNDEIQSFVEVNVTNDRAKSDYFIKRTMTLGLKTDKNGKNTSSLSTDSPWMKAVDHETGESSMVIAQKNRKKAESDEKVLEVIGVNKSVLDYVIFCHQEMSDWPLCEPKVLKERMDQIFSVDNYTKQMESYTKLVKYVKDQLELENVYFLSAKDNYRQYMKFKKEKKLAEQELDKMSSSYEDVSQDLKEDKKNLEKLTKKVEKFINDKAKLKSILVDDLKKIKPKDSLEKLQDKLKNLVSHDHEQNLEIILDELKNIKNEKNAAEIEVKKYEKDLNNFKHTVDKAESQLKERDGKLKKIIKIFMDVDDSDQDGDESMNNEASETSEDDDLLKEAKNDQENFQNILTDEENLKLRKKVLAYYEHEKQNIEEDYEEKEMTLNDCKAEKERMSIQRQLLTTQLGNDKAKYKRCFVEINSLEEKINKIDGGHDQSGQSGQVDFDKKIQKILNARKNFEQEELKLNENITKISKEINTSKQVLENLRTQEKLYSDWEKKNEEKVRSAREKSKLKDEIDSLKNRLRLKLNAPSVGLAGAYDLISDLLDSQNAESSEKRHKDFLQELQDELDTINSKQNKLYQEKIRQQDRLKLVRNEIDQLKEAISEDKEEIESHSSNLPNNLNIDDLENFDFTAEIQKLENLVKNIEFKKATSKGRKAILQEFLEIVESNSNGQKSCCPTCKKSLTNSEKRDVINDLNEMISDLDNLTQNSSKSKNSKDENLLALYKKLKPISERIIKNTKLLAQKKSEMKSFQSSMTKYSQELHPLEEQKQECESKIKAIENRNFGDFYAKCAQLNDIEEFEEVSSEDVMGDMAKEDPKAVPASEITTQEKLIKSKEKSIEKIRSEIKSTQNNIKENYKQEAKINNESANLLEDKLALKNKQAEYEQLEKSIQKSENEQNYLFEKLDPIINEKLPKAEEEFEAVKEDKEVHEKMQREIKDWANACKVCKQSSAFNNFTQGDKIVNEKSEKIKILSKNCKNLDEKIEEKLEEKDNLNRAINCLKDEKWTIERQIQYVKLENELTNLGISKTDSKKLEKMEEAIEEQEKEFNVIHEKMIQRKDRIKQAEKTLKDPQYATSKDKFITSCGKKTILEQQILDIGNLRKTILEEISCYHNKKMTLVNHLLSRYWKNIYCGRDIDTIYIECVQTKGAAGAAGKYAYKIMCRRLVKDVDEDGNSTSSASSSSKTKRGTTLKATRGRKRKADLSTSQASNLSSRSTSSFNNTNQVKEYYIEDELRGRCSTGQKAIACIVIRLALSQAFCSSKSSCRIFTLDEPTTSLDRKTIKSFCYSIFKIIDVFREAGSPLQLLIITHDQDFMKELYRKRKETVDVCIKVEKDKLGYSRLTRTPMDEIVQNLHDDH